LPGALSITRTSRRANAGRMTAQALRRIEDPSVDFFSRRGSRAADEID